MRSPQHNTAAMAALQSLRIDVMKYAEESFWKPASIILQVVQPKCNFIVVEHSLFHVFYI